jgi:hypothetical protein
MKTQVIVEFEPEMFGSDKELVLGLSALFTAFLNEHAFQIRYQLELDGSLGAVTYKVVAGYGVMATVDLETMERAESMDDESVLFAEE